MYHYASQVLLCLRPCHTSDGIQYDFNCKTVLINVTFFKSRIMCSSQLWDQEMIHLFYPVDVEDFRRKACGNQEIHDWPPHKTQMLPW